MARQRQPFTPCKLYIDGAEGLMIGDYIITAHGSAYLVQSIRPSPSRAGRLYLQCMRWPIDQIEGDARRYQFNWYRRPKRGVR